MEVHQHSHHEGKKSWKAYFWEFLMLFLAVFAGFLAENQREHYVEHQREKQYMRSMVQDLEIDLENIAISAAEKLRMVEFGDSMIELYLNDQYTHSNQFYYYARNFSSYQKLFIMTDGTLVQLKNSGGLRLIRKTAIVDSLLAYDNVYQQFKASQDREDRFLMDYRDMMAKIFDIRIFHAMVKKGYADINMPESNPPLFNENKQLINEMLIKVHIAKRNKLGSILYLSDLKEKAEHLLHLIKKEYHLE